MNLKSQCLTEEFNTVQVEGHHIRVDRACPPRKKMKGDENPLYDHKRTVFVGNLPFDVKVIWSLRFFRYSIYRDPLSCVDFGRFLQDEEVYQLFCGIKDMESNVEGVRIIRDLHNNLGKGFAYVLFKTRVCPHLSMNARL